MIVKIAYQHKAKTKPQKISELRLRHSSVSGARVSRRHNVLRAGDSGVIRTTGQAIRRATRGSEAMAALQTSGWVPGPAQQARGHLLQFLGGRLPEDLRNTQGDKLRFQPAVCLRNAGPGDRRVCEVARYVR